MQKPNTQAIFWGFLIFLALALIALGPLCQIRTTQKRPVEYQCMRRLVSISFALYRYAEDHDGKFPDDFTILIGPHLEPEHFVCPATRKRPQPGLPVADWSDYVFIPGAHFVTDANDKSDYSLIVAYCPPENHRGKKAIVLFADGHAENCEIDKFYRLLKEQVNKIFPFEI